MHSWKVKPPITGSVTVNASIEEVWRAWTTAEGVVTFFAPRCKIDARPGGSYEMFFDLDEEPGKQGAEGMIILALQPPEMLSFTWNAPQHLPNVRGQMTHVTVYLHALAPAQTQVILLHDGWGKGGEWDAAYAYFERVWKEVVLARLKKRFETGPVKW